MANQTEHIRSHAGPSLLVLAIVHTLLVAASIVPGILLKHGAAVVNPYSPAEGARRFFADNPVAIRVSTFFLFGSSVPLGIYAATVVSRLRFLGVRAGLGFSYGFRPDRRGISRFPHKVLAYLDGGALDDFVFQCGNAEWAKLTRPK